MADNLEFSMYHKIVLEFVLMNDPDPRTIKYTMPHYITNNGELHISGDGIVGKLMQPKFMLLACNGDKKRAKELQKGVIDCLWDRKPPAEWVYTKLKQAKKETK